MSAYISKICNRFNLGTIKITRIHLLFSIIALVDMLKSINLEKYMASYKFRKNSDIGKLDAETDSFLSECFYKSDIYNGLLNYNGLDSNPDFTKRIIVGRTGSGKTALLKMLSSDELIKGYDKIEAENTIFEHINNNIFISSLIDKGIDLRVFYKALWLHVLLVNSYKLFTQIKLQ